MRRNISLKT